MNTKFHVFKNGKRMAKEEYERFLVELAAALKEQHA